MKNSLTLSSLAIGVLASLSISIVAIVHSTWVHVDLDRRLEESAHRALRIRERELVQYYAPKFARMYEDIDIPDHNPETIEELLQPLIEALR